MPDGLPVEFVFPMPESSSQNPIKNPKVVNLRYIPLLLKKGLVFHTIILIRKDHYGYAVIENINA